MPTKHLLFGLDQNAHSGLDKYKACVQPFSFRTGYFEEDKISNVSGMTNGV